MKTFAFPAYRRRTREGAGASSNRNFWKVKGNISKHLNWHTYIISSTGWLQGWVRKVGDRKVWMSDGRWLGQWHHHTFTIGFFENGCSMAAWANQIDMMEYSVCHNGGCGNVSFLLKMLLFHKLCLSGFEMRQKYPTSSKLRCRNVRQASPIWNIWKCSFTGSQTKSSSLSLEADRQLHIGK